MRPSSSSGPIAYHLARLLLLIGAFSTGRSSLKGLTKLAKLDFLLRYPVMLERLLTARQIGWPGDLAPTEAERTAIESEMIRYKYGPWDDLYYPLIGALIGMELVSVVREEETLALRITPRGRDLGERWSATEWAVVNGRARLLKRHFDRTGNSLRSMIYSELPEVVDRPLRSVI